MTVSSYSQPSSKHKQKRWRSAACAAYAQLHCLFAIAESFFYLKSGSGETGPTVPPGLRVISSEEGQSTNTVLVQGTRADH